MSEENLSATPQIDIVDPDEIRVCFVDWILSAGQSDGVVNVALGTIDHSLRKTDDLPARIVVASRLRFSRAFAQRLHSLLGDVLRENPDAPPPAPSNKLN